jgi:hypothetical protein
MNPLLGGYSNDEASRFPRENAGYSQTYNAIPTGEIGAYGNTVLGSQYRASIAGNNMDFHGRPYVENRNFQPFNYSTHGRPSVEYRDFQPDLHTPAADTCSYSCNFSLFTLFFN